MKKLLFLLACIWASGSTMAQIPLTHQTKARKTINLDKGWSFIQEDVKGAEALKFKDKHWQKLDVPHDWSIEGTFDRDEPSGRGGGYLPTGIGWYRKQLEIPKEYADKKIYVHFDGVMSHSTVYVNGKEVGSRDYGYSAFQYDITKYLAPGKKNVIAVRCDNSLQPNSRWYTGCGVYRHVQLIVTNRVNIDNWGVFITTPYVSAENSTVSIQTAITNHTGQLQHVKVKSTLYAPDNTKAGSSINTIGISPGATLKVEQDIHVANPQIWDLNHPQVYEAVSQIIANGTTIDDAVNTFGIRSMQFEPETGFYLNGENIKIQGVCLHHDGGAFGSAVPLAVWAERLAKLKSIGVNGIRCAHNPFADEFYDLCDRMGMLVMDESLDTWTATKNHSRYGYQTLFEKNWEKDTRTLILKSRNHPAVFIYSLGNEIRDRIADKSGQERFIRMRDIAHELDPSRPNTVALFRPNSEWAQAYTNGFAELMDVVGQNYRENELVRAHLDKPERIVIGTENGHSRAAMQVLRDNPFMSGQFIWTGYDYIGEADWPEIDHGFGIFTRIGTRRPVSYQRESWWGKKPVAYLARRETNAGGGNWVSDWTPKDYDTYDVAVMEVYSNCEEVELFLNGKSLGKKPVPADGASVPYQCAYEKGTIKVVGYNGGKEAASQSFVSAGYVEKLTATSSKQTLAVNPDDVATITIKAVDDQGVHNPLADAMVYFEVEGPGIIAGVDNGDIECHTSMKGSAKRLYRGETKAYIQATGEGTITIKAKGKFLPEISVSIEAKGSEFKFADYLK
ncbi:MAG: sugar-binding domain-containing protein [Mangrovibacterium sp.]